MKELSIEEKAKAYDEAIKKAKGVIEQNPLMEYLKKGIEYIFPELKESEDEKIREEIKVVLANTDLSQFALDYTFADMITWLKKQGEQKPAIIIPKFRVGDEIKTTNEAPEGMYKID